MSKLIWWLDDQTLGLLNRFIRERYLPDHNARFAQPPEQPESAFASASLAQVCDILCR